VTTAIIIIGPQKEGVKYNRYEAYQRVSGNGFRVYFLFPPKRSHSPASFSQVGVDVNSLFFFCSLLPSLLKLKNLASELLTIMGPALWISGYRPVFDPHNWSTKFKFIRSKLKFYSKFKFIIFLLLFPPKRSHSPAASSSSKVEVGVNSFFFLRSSSFSSQLKNPASEFTIMGSALWILCYSTARSRPAHLIEVQEVYSFQVEFFSKFKFIRSKLAFFFGWAGFIYTSAP